MPMQAPATPPGPAPSPVPGSRRPGSIVRRLVVFGLGLAVPILIFGGVVLWQFAGAARGRLESEALGRARIEAAAVDRELASLIATLEALSLSNALQRGDVTAFREQVQELARRSGLPTILRDPDGRRLIDLGSEPIPERIDAADAAALGGRPAVSGVIDGRFRVTVPVMRRGGEAVLYLLSFSLPTSRLRDVLASGGVPKDWVMSVIDRDHRVLTRTRLPERFTGAQAPDELRAATGPEGHWRGSSLEGEPFFIAYARAGVPDWRVAVGVPEEALAAPVRASLVWFAGLGVMLSAIAAVLALAFARGIAAPLHALRDQAVALGLGRAAPVLAGVPAEVAAVSAEIAGAAQRQRERTAERARAASALRAETQRLEVLNRLGTALSSELDRQRLGDAVVEAATHLTGAAYGALFERVPEGPDGPEHWRLLSLTGGPREAFTRFGLPRVTNLFSATFAAGGVVLSEDVTTDPRYGSHGGMPHGHLPVRSYLAVPVVSGTGSTLGALLFGHPEPHRFGTREAAVIEGLAGQAAVAMDNARLFASVRREQDRFAAAVQAVRGVLWTNGPDGRMTGDQPAWAALTGQSPEQYEGYGWAEAVHPDDRAASVESWNAAVAERRRYTHEHRVRRHDGVFRTYAIQAVPVLDPDGTIREWVGVHSDITEQRAAEAALRESNEEIQRYAYIVSHDLRAPLVNIMGFTSEIEASQDDIRTALAGRPDAARIDADLAESVSFIKAAITKMDGLINAILKLSREGRRNFQPEPLAMTALVQSLADAQRHQADTVAAVITIGELPDIVADRVALGQIFGNLIDNAIKYLAKDRPGRIAVTGTLSDGLAVIRVSDNGRGIDARDHARVFELFRRSGVQDRPGEGIGLAHVRTLVRALGGRIDLESEFGAGTTFTVTLPLRQA
ncbi:ATP-binding protein [Methylobacterium sp. SyP6R]|uniref:ATP-binding protein n=1 Tax=Methylobacterium sp. SyP6R TaxID=2718876 RepID=UPI001F334B86|nr:ATP-binding protein [Methylobacterium sp. SyP6R]